MAPFIGRLVPMTARQWSAAHFGLLLSACAFFALAVLFVFIPLQRHKMAVSAQNAADLHDNADTNNNVSRIHNAIVTSEESSGVLFSSMYEAIVNGPQQSRDHVIRQKNRHWISQTLVAWSFTFSSLCFFLVELLEAFWLWTQVKPRGRTFVDEEGSSTEEDEVEQKRKREGGETDAENEKVELNRFYPFGNRTAEKGYGGTVNFDNEQDHDDDGDSCYAPNDHDYDDFGESANLDRVLDATKAYPLSLFPRPDRRILKSLRITCVFSLVANFADVFCFVVYTPQMRASLNLLPFGFGKLLSKFLLFWADRLMFIGLLCMIASVGWKAYRRLFLCSARETALIKYPPFSFFSR
eukprot:GILI01015845.1.p1 GENE.GILI01015845.1~~GILI01015845.1.p1  ORF type:complete len:353 (-),score=27.17 GILI01015845.1:86-1144(-)